MGKIKHIKLCIFFSGSVQNNSVKYYIDAIREWNVHGNESIWKWGTYSTTAFFNDTDLGYPVADEDCAYITEDSTGYGLGAAKCTENLGFICYKGRKFFVALYSCCTKT